MSSVSDSDGVTSRRTGRYGAFGGQYVPPVLLPLLRALEAAYGEAQAEPAFARRVAGLLRDFINRPTPLQAARGLTRHLGGAALYLKREDLSAAGGSFAAAAVGQCLLAQRMGFGHVITDTGSGQHGVALARTAEKLGLRCTIFIAESDALAHGPLVACMRASQAQVKVVRGKECGLHEAKSAALRCWMSGADRFYVAGAPTGPHPYPAIVRHFQAVVGEEVRAQTCGSLGRAPDALLAPAGGGGTALSLFSAFIHDPGVRLIAVEGGGTSTETDAHAARLAFGRTGVLHGAKTRTLQDDDGQILPAHSAAAGLRYPGIAPELAWLHRQRRLEGWIVRDHQARDAQQVMIREEGLSPSIEACHGAAAAMQIARLLPTSAVIVIPLTSSMGEPE